MTSARSHQQPSSGSDRLHSRLRSHFFLLSFSFGAASALMAPGCVQQPRAAVSLGFQPPARAVRDATVTIDEEYIGPLGYVANHGVRLPVGEHRITVEKDGYFPFDTIVVADRQPIHLAVELVPIPD